MYRNFRNSHNCIQKHFLSPNNIWVTRTNPYDRQTLTLHPANVVVAFCLQTIVRFDFVLYYIVYIAFACLLCGITKQIVTGVIVHHWKLFPLSWGNIALGLWPGQYFPNFGAIISNNELDASHYLYNIGYIYMLLLSILSFSIK